MPLPNGNGPDTADFEVMVGIAAQPGKYPVIVTRSPNGPAFGMLNLDPDSEEFVTALTLASGPEDAEAERRAFGQLLFDSLFAGDVGQALATSRALITVGGVAKSLRLRLWLADPVLAGLPWELMYSKAQGRYLVTKADLALIRYLPVPEPPPLQATERIRILVIFESPTGGEIDVKHRDNLAKILEEHQDVAEVKILNTPAVEQIRNALAESPPFQIVHYLGHGSLNKLYVANDTGARRSLGQDEYATLFDGRRIPLVVLNACGSGPGEPERGLFSGVAPALIRYGVLAVAGMQYDFVTVDAAQRFSETFYRALLKNHLPIDLAMSEARMRLLADLGPAKRAWSTPVLYLSTQSTMVLSMLRKGETETSHMIRVVGSQVAVSTEARTAFEKLHGTLKDMGELASQMSASVSLKQNVQSARRILDTVSGQLDKARDLTTADRNALTSQLQNMVNQELASVQAAATDAYSGKAGSAVSAGTKLATQIAKQNFGTAETARQELSAALVELDKTVERDNSDLLDKMQKTAAAARMQS